MYVLMPDGDVLCAYRKRRPKGTGVGGKSIAKETGWGFKRIFPINPVCNTLGLCGYRLEEFDTDCGCATYMGAFDTVEEAEARIELAIIQAAVKQFGERKRNVRGQVH